MGKLIKYFGVVVLSMLVYRMFIAPDPPVPFVDPDEWWGPQDQQSHQNTSIRPFSIEFSDVMINDLKERLMHRRPFTPPLEGVGFTYGVNSYFLDQILEYWKNSYDFKGQEQHMNDYPNFKTNIQGLDVHYTHVKPYVDEKIKVVPLLLLHGWPSSVREFYRIIPMLATARGGYNFTFELVIPSLPGFGYSEAPRRPGLGKAQMAVIMRNLMRRLGHRSFYIHGGDWGTAIATDMSILFPTEVLGLHSSYLINYSKTSLLAWFAYAAVPCLLHEHEQQRMLPVAKRLPRLLEEAGFLLQQATKPDTLGIALTNCPAGLAAYILEKFSAWNDPLWRRAQDGDMLKNFFLAELLDNVMIYWTTESITTSMRLFAETFSYEQRALGLNRIPTKVPAWAMKNEHELVYQTDFIIGLKYHNLVHSMSYVDGGHFAAFERPLATSDDIFSACHAFQLLYDSR